MKSLLVFAAGILARAISAVAQSYADWLLCKVAGGMEAGTSFLSDLVLFVQTLLQEMARQICGRHTAAALYYEEEYRERERWR